MVKPSYSNVIHVTLDGAKLPTEYADLLVGGWVDLGAGVPGAFRLTFRDPHGLLLGKLNVRFGTKVVIAPVGVSVRSGRTAGAVFAAAALRLRLRCFLA